MMKTSSFALVSSYSKTSKNDENFEKWSVWPRYRSIDKTSKNDENFEKLTMTRYARYLQKMSKTPSQTNFKHTVYGSLFLPKGEGFIHDYQTLPEIML